MNPVTKSKEPEIKHPLQMLSPVFFIFGSAFVEIGLVAKTMNGINPVCYHRSLTLFIIGVVITGFSILGTKKLFSGFWSAK
jgi:hypothetical protein